MGNNNCYIVTGGPGVGKTTLLNSLAKENFIVVPEEARRIIQEQVEMDGDALPWKNKALYAEYMFKDSIATFGKMSEQFGDTICFFDRGILDTICYMAMEGLNIPDIFLQSEKECRYNRKVFILPPWPEIYITDGERKQTWDEAVNTFYWMMQTYSLFGYETIEVPKGNVEMRKKFILDEIKL